MKKNTRKLLTWLWGLDEFHQQPMLAVNVPALMPELTQGGVTSLLHHLHKEALISVSSVAGQSYLYLTTHGRKAITDRFPALSRERQAWAGEWTVLIFLQPPSTDPHFRYLRIAALKYGAQALQRGVYLIPGEPPVALAELCNQLYRDAVVMFHTSRWLFGDERAVVTKLFMLSAVAESLSGVSKSIDQLLDSSSAQSDTTHRANMELFTVFDRLIEILAIDYGLVHHYFPQVESSARLVERLLDQTMFDSNRK